MSKKWEVKKKFFLIEKNESSVKLNFKRQEKSKKKICEREKILLHNGLTLCG